MARAEPIDVTFNFTSDTPDGQDPDAASPTLRRYHRLLWSKPLPSGAPFELVDTTPNVYLHRRSPREFFLSSDAVVPTFSRHLRLQHIIEQIPEADVQAFWNLGYTIGAMMVFPANKIDGKMTINGARGFHPRIKDRFDLTLECIRRHYHAEDSPLRQVLERYADFFNLFGHFKGYVDFFLLQDLVTDDASAVRFSMPFDGFDSSPLPENIHAYEAYRKLAVEFIESRNRRIASTSLGAPNTP